MNATTNRYWVPGDWNAFFGFGTNILVNLLTLTSLLRFVLKMPDSLVFGRILPATHMIEIMRGVVLRDAGPAELWPNVAALVAISVLMGPDWAALIVIVGCAALMFRKPA